MGATWLLLALLAPIPYWLLGAACLAWWRDGSRSGLVPIVGVAAAGFVAELAFFVGVSVRFVLPAALLLAALVVWRIYRERWRDWRAALTAFAPLYGATLLASTLSPFPILGAWSGDWLYAYRQGVGLMTDQFTAEMIARPPLFGSAAIVLWLVKPGLATFQLSNAVGCAGALLALSHFARVVWGRALPRSAMLLVACSPFFLHHSAAAWPKLLSAGLTLIACAEAIAYRRDRNTQSLVMLALCTALAIATHEGVIVWVPLVLACAVPGGQLRQVIRPGLATAAAGLLITAPFVVWSLATFGLDARVAANPAISDRVGHPLVNGFQVMLTTVVGYAPVEVIARWLSHPNPLAAMVKESFWMADAWLTTLAGTLLGVALPFIAAMPKLTRWQMQKVLPDAGPLVWGAIAVGWIASSFLSPFYSSYGTMQSAMANVGLVLAAFLALRAAEEPKAHRRALGWQLVLGTVPWVLWNSGIALGLRFSVSFENRFRIGSEGDYHRLLSNGLTSLWQEAGGWVIALGVALVGWGALRERKVLPASHQPAI